MPHYSKDRIQKIKPNGRTINQTGGINKHKKTEQPIQPQYHPWCLSIVCDPVQNKIGYFLGEKAQKVEPNFFRTQDTRQEALKSDTN